MIRALSAKACTNVLSGTPLSMSMFPDKPTRVRFYGALLPHETLVLRIVHKDDTTSHKSMRIGNIQKPTPQKHKNHPQNAKTTPNTRKPPPKRKHHPQTRKNQPQKRKNHPKTSKHHPNPWETKKTESARIGSAMPNKPPVQRAKPIPARWTRGFHIHT